MNDVAEFTVVLCGTLWRVRQDGVEFGRFSRRDVAEGLVSHLVEHRCAEGKASRIVTLEGRERKVEYCRCFAARPIERTERGH